MEIILTTWFHFNC